jgi:hypothetical protein
LYYEPSGDRERLGLFIDAKREGIGEVEGLELSVVCGLESVVWSL